jgi:hypothetical protein
LSRKKCHIVSNDINDLGKKFKKNAASLNKTKGRRQLLDNIFSKDYIVIVIESGSHPFLF